MSAEPETSLDLWHAERSESGDAWNVLDENRLRVATVHRADKDAQAKAILLAAAPALRAALCELFEWAERNVAYGVPLRIAEPCSRALQESRPPR